MRGAGPAFKLDGLVRATYLGSTDLIAFCCVGEGFDDVTESRLPKTVYIWDRERSVQNSVRIFKASPESTSVNTWSLVGDQGQKFTFITESTRKGVCHHWVNPCSLEVIPLPLLPNTRILGGVGKGLLLFAPPVDEQTGEELWGLDFELFCLSRQFEKTKLFVCSSQQSLQDGMIEGDNLYVQVLENVVSKLLVKDLKNLETESAEGYPLLDGLGSVTELFSIPGEGIGFFYTDFTQPRSLKVSNGRSTRTLHVAEDRRGTKETQVRQHWATSADNTKIPFFVIRSGTEPRPAIIRAYGGFGNSQTPFYSQSVDQLWLDRGGTYIVANVRGGGEFGSRWHSSAVKEHRQRSFEDLLAVASAACELGLTHPGLIGLWGWSNGGLLAANVALREPALFGAIVCVAPLLDMQRYLELSKAPFWKREYGDPSIPRELEGLKSMSAYHLIEDAPSFPPSLFITATNDDRVHPAHSRKMVAKLQFNEEKYGRALLYEFLSGGHAGRSTDELEVPEEVLTYAFFRKYLFGEVDVGGGKTTFPQKGTKSP